MAMHGTILKEKPSFISIDRTDRLLSDQGFTYNEAGKTYNEVGMTYGGVYLGDGKKPNNSNPINL